MIRLSRAWWRSDQGRFTRASAIGGAIALLLFLWLGARGRPDLLEWQRSGDFYDAQARSWLDGTWQVSGGVLGIERFESHGGTYMYQGPWPAVLRVPIVAVTERFDGRLSLLSMTAGLGLAIAATTRLHWRVRHLVRGATAVTRADTWVAGAMTLAVAGGSALLYEASRPWVYHEAAIWGAAWSIAAIDAAVGCVTDPRRRRFVWAAVATTLALWSRSSVGLGGVAALAILAVGNLLLRIGRTTREDGGRGARVLGWFRSYGSAPTAAGRLPVVAPAAAAVVPLALYAVVNWIKFRTLFSIPFWGQGFTILDPKRQAFLEANDGTLFGTKFAPTTIVHYLRPDALDLTRTFPFVDFPEKAHAVGGVEFDLIDYSSSIPSSMPALAVLAVIGIVILCRRSRSAPGTGVSALRGPTVGAAAGALTMIPFGYIAHRYLADAVPLLVIAGAVGVQRLLEPSPSRPTLRRAAWIGLGVLALAGVWINLSLGVIFQRLYSPNVKDDLVAGFLDTRYGVSRSLGLDADPSIIRVGEDEDLPLDIERGQLAVVGDCDAMYLADGLDLNAVKFTPWNPVERTEDGGRYLRRIEFPDKPPGTRLPLLSMHSSAGDGILYAEWIDGGVRFEYRGPGEAYPSPLWFLPPGEEHTMDLVADPRMNFVQVFLGDKLHYENFYPVPNDTTVDVGVDTVGDPSVEDRWDGTFVPLPERGQAVCETLVAEDEG